MDSFSRPLLFIRIAPEQWMLRITAYAERLLGDLDSPSHGLPEGLDWGEVRRGLLVLVLALRRLLLPLLALPLLLLLTPAPPFRAATVADASRGPHL